MIDLVDADEELVVSDSHRSNTKICAGVVDPLEITCSVRRGRAGGLVPDPTGSFGGSFLRSTERGKQHKWIGRLYPMTYVESRDASPAPLVVHRSDSLPTGTAGALNQADPIEDHGGRWLLVAVAVLLASCLCLAYGLSIVFGDPVGAVTEDATSGSGSLVAAAYEPVRLAASSSASGASLSASPTATQDDIRALQALWGKVTLTLALAMIGGLSGVAIINKVGVDRLRANIGNLKVHIDDLNLDLSHLRRDLV